MMNNNVEPKIAFKDIVILNMMMTLYSPTASDHEDNASYNDPDGSRDTGSNGIDSLRIILRRNIGVNTMYPAPSIM